MDLGAVDFRKEIMKTFTKKHKGPPPIDMLGLQCNGALCVSVQWDRRRGTVETWGTGDFDRAIWPDIGDLRAKRKRKPRAKKSGGLTSAGKPLG